MKDKSYDFCVNLGEESLFRESRGTMGLRNYQVSISLVSILDGYRID